MKTIIKSEPWKLFVVFIIPWLVAIMLYDKEKYRIIMNLDILLVMFIPLCWIVLVDNELYKMVKGNFPNLINTKLFKINLSMFILFGLQITMLLFLPVQPYLKLTNYFWFRTLSFFISIFGTYTIFYFFYFLSKYLIILEKGLDVDKNKYWTVFIAVWFYPIGIWFVQPRIRKILNSIL